MKKSFCDSCSVELTDANIIIPRNVSINSLVVYVGITILYRGSESKVDICKSCGLKIVTDLLK